MSATKILTNSQKNWRHGYFTGIRQGSGGTSDSDELEQLRSDSRLLSIMRGMGVDDRESRMYWHGMEQAVAIYCDLYRSHLPDKIDIDYPENY